MKKALAIALMTLFALPLSANADLFKRSLAVGSRGDDVTMLQQILTTKGFFKVAATGYFGTITKQSVAAFQSANGLEAVGSIGPKTRALLNSIVALNLPAIPPIPMVPTPPAPSATTSVSTDTSAQATTGTTTTQPIAPIAPITPATPASDELTVTVLTPAMLPVNTTITQLSVATNRPALCRWGTNPQMQLQSMNGFQSQNGTIHTYEFSSLSNGSLYVYYIKCEDVGNLKVTPEVMASFKVSTQ